MSGGARRELCLYAAAQSYLQRSQVDGGARCEQRFYAAAHAFPVEYFLVSFLPARKPSERRRVL
jgi:hypothetical protein